MSKIHASSNGHKRTCGLCQNPIKQGERVNNHHPIYKSEGGIETIEVHQKCHVAFHSSKGDFRVWAAKVDERPPQWASGSSTSSTREVRPTLSGGFLSATDSGRPETQMARASRDVTAHGKPDYEPSIQRSESNAIRIQQLLD